MDKEQFIESIAIDVKESCNRWGLYPSIAIAQFCIESAYGTSELAVNANNIAGKKWNKDLYPPYYKITKEYLTGTVEENTANGFELIDEETGLYKKSLPFNFYPSWAECIEHYCKNLIESKWYSRAVNLLPDYEGFLCTMASIYAPNHPTYANDIRRVIIEYNLTQYD